MGSDKIDLVSTDDKVSIQFNIEFESGSIGNMVPKTFVVTPKDVSGEIFYDCNTKGITVTIKDRNSKKVGKFSIEYRSSDEWN